MPTPPIPLLMTRPSDAAQRFVSELPPELRARLIPVYAPLMKISTVPATPDLSDVRGVIFTSVNGIVAAPSMSQDSNPTAYCVGQTTAGSARDKGWNVKYIGLDANDLIQQLLQARISGPMIHLCGRHTRGSIAERLTQAGISTQRLVVYDQELQEFPDEVLSSLRRKPCIIAPVFSPRSARHFVSQCTGLRGLHLVALSDAVAEPLKAIAYSSMLVATAPTAQSLISAIEKCVDRLSRVERSEGAQ